MILVKNFGQKSLTNAALEVSENFDVLRKNDKGATKRILFACKLTHMQIYTIFSLSLSLSLSLPNVRNDSLGKEWISPILCNKLPYLNTKTLNSMLHVTWERDDRCPSLTVPSSVGAWVSATWRRPMNEYTRIEGIQVTGQWSQVRAVFTYFHFLATVINKPNPLFCPTIHFLDKLHVSVLLWKKVNHLC